MKQIKLNRHDHIALMNLRDSGMPGITGKDLDKLTLLNLAISVAQGRSCSYQIGDMGEKYLTDNPEIPKGRMTETQAAEISRMLGDETYECAPAFNSKGSAFTALITDRFVEKSALDAKQYQLSTDGREAFEDTQIGAMYLERMKEVKLREAIDAAWEKKKPATPLASAGYRAKAKLAKKMGSPNYAKILIQAAERAEPDERITAVIVAGDGFEISVADRDKNTGFPMSIRVSHKATGAYGSTHCWKWKQNDKIFTSRWTPSYSMYYYENEKIDSETILRSFSALAFEIIRVTELLNEKLPPPYVEPVNS